MQHARLTMMVALVAAVALGCGNAPSAAQSPAAAPAAPAGGSDQVVAEVNGRKITLAEVDAKWQELDAGERARLTQQLYQNRRNMLDLVMGDVLIAEAAKAANLSVESYSERELARRLQPVTDADVQRFYDENKERTQGRTLEQLRQPILDFLGSQRQQQARAKLVDDLRTKAGDLRVMLEPPRVEVTLAATDPSRGPDTAPVTIVEYSDYQ
jgi:protein-disulfide isomerase